MNPPTISLIIIAYNEEKVLAKCLDAIAKQTLAPYEVILVDNNSTDRTAAIANSYPFVKVVNETTQGMIPARNRGFAEATGQIFARIDADTVINKKWVAVLSTMFDDTRVGGATGPGGVVEVSPEDFSFGEIFSKYNFAINKRIHKMQVLWGSNMAITSSAWSKIAPEVCMYDKKVHEDLDLSILLHKHGYKIKYSTKLKVNIHGLRFVSLNKVKEYHKRSLATRRYHKARDNYRVLS
jgi:glycosyltransferase involved in cell wall biosynthesis